MRGRQQPNFMPELYQRPPPMMRRGARLHRHHAWRQRGEKRDELVARELVRRHDLALRVDRVNLKYSLRQIRTNPRNSAKFRIDLPMDGFPSDGVSTTTILAR